MSGKDYLPVREVWEFEAHLASQPDVWISEARNLKGAAEALLLYDQEVSDCVQIHKRQPPLKAFFSARVIRMLFGFSLKNLVKAILLQDKEELEKAFPREGNLSWGDKGHDLLWLFVRAGVKVSGAERKEIVLWQVCALWAGRYPLPLNENALPRQRKPLSSHEALLQRTQTRIKNSMEEGDLWRGAELQDVLHSGVGDREIDMYRKIFDRGLNFLKSGEL